MKKISAIALIMSVIALSFLFGNGGNVYSDGFKSSGNITLSQAKNISLIREDLYITLKQDLVEVNVTYQLDNRDVDQTIKYGFPFRVDNNYSSSGEDDWIPVYRISLNNKRLTYNKKIYNNNVKSKEGLNENEIIRWHLSDLPLKNGINRIEVSYSIKPYKADIDKPDPVFEYDFKPAATWDNGIVKEIKITLDRSNINEPGMEVYYSGFNYNNDRKQDKIIIIKNNVDLFKMENIIAYYNFSEYRFNRDFSFKNSISNRNINKITASSTLSMKYTKANLIDEDFNTSWVEGKADNGVGEWIEVEFNNKGDGLPNFVGIMNGYYQNEELYYANNRIKSLKLTITEHIQPEEMSSAELKLGYVEYKFDEIIELPDLKYVKPDIQNASKYLSTLHTNPPGTQDRMYTLGIKKIRFEILSVYPGKKYNDTCIAELLTFK